MTEPLLKPREAAAILGIDVTTLRDLCAAGRVAFYVPGASQSHRRFKREDLEAYLESTRVEVKRPRIESARMRRIGRPDGRPQRWE